MLHFIYFVFLSITTVLAWSKPGPLRLYNKRSRAIDIHKLAEDVSDVELNLMLDESLSDTAVHPLMLDYDLTRFGLLKRFSGTILESTWHSVVLNMFIAVCLTSFFRKFGVNESASGVWKLWRPPSPDTFKWYQQLMALDNAWHYIMTLSTFTLTFFLNEAYSTYMNVIKLGRKMQGRLNDFGMFLAQRSKRNSNGNIEPAAMDILKQCSRYIRLFSLLHYSGQTRKHAILKTPRGISALVKRGFLTELEAQSILNSPCIPSQRHWIVLHWLFMLSQKALDKNLLVGDRNALETLFDARAHELRGASASFSDELDDGPPLAYAHFVQLLTDGFVILCPFALYPEMGAWCVPVSGILTLFYQGLLNLAKSFLDPLDQNEDTNMKGDVIQWDTMIAESNSGASRWINAAAAEIPF